MFLAHGDNTRKLIAVLLVSLMLGTIATSMAATEVVVSGSTTVGPLGVLCADAFNANQTQYHVSVAQTGTGAGVTALAQGQADIAMASREVTADEKTKYGDKFVETPIGYDGIAICVSKPVYDAGVKALTIDQVKMIYAGNITNWKELGGPDAQIYAVSREQGSGTLANFLTDVMGNANAQTPGVKTYANGNSEVKTAITGSDKAIGYLGYSYSQSGDLGVVTLNGIKLTEAAVKDKTYPLARKLYLDTFGGQPTNGADSKVMAKGMGAKAFIDFVLGAGQKIAKENGFIAL
jgi:phosphate transport system substrate-binding protein